ncbi:MAG: T9SS type A sorting domain-containing protein [Candidatus Zixiibacteriota bacterium]|mgnify:FL=1
MNKIARLLPDGWAALDSGISPEDFGGVSDMAIYRNDLIASGSFVSSPTYSMNEIRSWDGNAWQALGDNPKLGICAKIATFADNLFALGSLSFFGELEDSILLAEWNGELWSPVDFRPSPFWYGSQELAELAVYNDELIAGGHFDSVNGIAAKNVVAWDGSTWHAFGNSDEYYGPQRITAVLNFKGELVVGGIEWAPFLNQSQWSVGRWDGNSWHPLGSKFSATLNEWYNLRGVYALEEYNGQLYAAGSFDSIGGEPFNNIAVWDGTRWMPLGSGITKVLNIGGFASYMPVVIYDLHAHANKLYVAGDFTEAGSHVSFGLASWSKGITTGIPDSRQPLVLPEQFELKQNYPNPFNLTTTIEFTVSRKSVVRCEVHNILGQRVKTLLSSSLSAGAHKIVWDGQSDGGTEVASGIYIYELTVGEAKQSRKMILLK